MTALERIQAFVKIAKDYINKHGDYEPKNGEWPNLYPGYQEACRQRDEILIHSTDNEFPERQFARLMKSMDEEGLKWMRENYNPVTHGVYNDFLNTASRATTNIYIEDKGVEESVLEYFTEGIPIYENMTSYAKSILPSLIIQDAMGVFGIVPEMVQTEDIDEETAVIVGDINPMPQFYECWRVIHYKNGKECIVIRPEKSLVKYGNTSNYSGLVFDVYTDTVIERYSQTGRQVDFDFELTMVFPHGLDWMPALRAGGIPRLRDNELTYVSHFYAAVPLLNLAMQDAAYLNAVKRKCAFPIPVMVADECTYVELGGTRCIDGHLSLFEGGEEIKKVCPSCKGTGKGQSLNPFSTMFAPATSRENDTKYSASEVLSYVSPDPATMKLLRDEVELQLSKAAQEIKINRSVGMEGNVTATEKGIDHKATQAFIKQFLDILISRWNWLIQTTSQMKWATDTGFTVLASSDFDLKTTYDYIEEIKLAQDAKMNPYIVSELLSRYLYTASDGSEIGEKMIETVLHADRFFGVSEEELAMRGDLAERWERVLHDSAFVLLMNIVEKDASWVDKSLEDRVTILQNEARTITPTRTTAAVEQLFDGEA